MALFKISKGLSKNLMTNVPYAKEGFAYFTSDDGKFYIDINGDGTNASPAVIGENRIPLSALSTDWIKATKIEDAEAYPILAFRMADSTKNLIELKYGSIGYKDGTLVIPNVETGNKDEVLIENNDEGSALIIDNKGAGTGIKIINTGEDSLATNQGININNSILLNMNGSASFNGPVTMGGTSIFVGGPANVLGTNKTNTIISNQLTLQQGAVFGGNAQNAGLVTRGICGISTPTDDGTCEKDNLYINYDGDNSYKASRHVILQAGEAGEDYGHHLYQYAAARGDAVHDWSLNNFYIKSDIDNKLNNLLATNDAMVFKGTIGGDAAATIHELPAKHSAGETYRVYDIKGGNNGKYLGNGEVCEIGDLIICIKDGTTHSAGDWTIVQTNIDGAVINTDGSSTDGHIAIFSGNKGRTIKDSGKSFNDLATANHTHTKLVNGQYAVDFNGASLSPINNPQNTIDLGNISNPWKNLYLTSDIQLKGTTGNWETLTEKLDGKSNTGHTHQITANVDTSNSKEGAIIKLEGTGGTNAVTYKATHADKGPSMANNVSSITTTSNANKSLAGEFGKTLTLNIPRITIDKQGHVNAVTNDEVPIALPSAPTIGNGELTIKVGKTPVEVEETFTANQTTDKDIPLPVYTITETDTLLSGKANSSHAHNYAGSSSAGGPATSADKLNTNNVGSETVPVYFKDGIPVVTGLTLDRDISGNAETATIAGKVEHALNISVGGTPKGSYDGSAARTIDVNAADLKISGALVYIGRVATKPTSSQVTLIDGTTVTAVAGNVVICTGDKKEYLYDTDGNWVDLGSSTSYALKPHIHGNISSDGYLTNEAGVVQTNSIVYSDPDGKINKGPTFDTTNTTKRFLAENGNWEQSSHHISGSWNGLTYTAESINNAGELKFTIPTGTGATSVALGNHNHDKVYKKVQTAVSSPEVSTTNKDISFIDTISQDTQGKITATKKTVRDASTSQSGIVSTGAQTLAGEKTLNDKTHFSKGFDLKTSSGNAQFNANTVSVSNGTDYVDLYVSTINGGNDNKTRPLVLNANSNGYGNVGIGITQPTEKLEVDGNVKATQFKGNADTADKWKTARKLTIGSAEKEVDGSADVNWSLDDIGAAAKKHTHTKSDITDFAHTHDDRYYTENEINDKLKAINDKIGALLGANDALVFKGIIDEKHPLPTTDYEVGHTYRVNAAGTYAGQKCEQGDLIICIADASSTSTPHWTVAQTNIDGAVIGPNTSTANAVPTFVNETGKVIKNNPAVTIDETGLFTAPYIATGTDKNHTHYFQSEKFRGEGNADTYYHAIDFGYAGHNQVDFHEYGGIWNFYQNTGGAAADGKLVASIKPDGFHGNLKGNATSADKVNNNLVIKLDSGTTEGTNQFTYNGSAVKNINITSSSIGAASSSHDHDSSYVKKSGDTMTGDLTAPTFHGELNGNADTATKFASAQSITLTGDVTGTASSQAGWSITTTLSDSGVTNGTYGPSKDVNGSNGATISVPQITVDAKGRVTSIVNRTYTSVNTDTNTTYSAGAGLTLSGTQFKHSNSITAGSVGTAQSPSHGDTFAIPKITYDAQGHITEATTVNITLPADNNTDTNVTTAAQTSSKIYVTGTPNTGTVTGTLQYNKNVYISGNVMYGACWNDYAEYRISNCQEPGRVICENGDDTLSLSTERLQPAGNVISDTFGFVIGETEQAKTPVAVSGRVLAYPYESREEFKKNIGRPVCSGPNGTVSIMTDKEYRDKGYCAIGIISAVPDYEEWGAGKVKVNGRVWIKIF